MTRVGGELLSAQLYVQLGSQQQLQLLWQSHLCHTSLCFMATQVKKCALLMPFKKEENNSRFLCKNQTSEKALKYFDGTVTFNSNNTRVKVSDG